MISVVVVVVVGRCCRRRFVLGALMIAAVIAATALGVQATTEDRRCFLANGGSSQTLLVHENANVGADIGQVGVLGEPQQDINLQLQISNGNPAVEIVPGSKILRLAYQLDKEELDGPSKVDLKVECTRVGSSEAPVVIPVYIKVLDANDRAPYFIGGPYAVNVSEMTAVGSTVIEVLAKDEDQDGPFSTITYSIVPDAYSDQGKPPLYGETSLTVQVLDGDDRNPKFLEESYYGIVPEPPVRGARVPVGPKPIMAYDQDTGLGMPVIFSLLMNGEESEYFTINPKDGALYVYHDVPDDALFTPFTLVVKRVVYHLDACPENPDEKQTAREDFNAFTVTSPAGEVVLIKPLDYETKENYCYIATASDGRQSSVPVQVVFPEELVATWGGLEGSALLLIILGILLGLLFFIVVALVFYISRNKRVGGADSEASLVGSSPPPPSSVFNAPALSQAGGVKSLYMSTTLSSPGVTSDQENLVSTMHRNLNASLGGQNGGGGGRHFRSRTPEPFPVSRNTGTFAKNTVRRSLHHLHYQNASIQTSPLKRNNKARASQLTPGVVRNGLTNPLAHSEEVDTFYREQSIRSRHDANKVQAPPPPPPPPSANNRKKAPAPAPPVTRELSTPVLTSSGSEDGSESSQASYSPPMRDKNNKRGEDVGNSGKQRFSQQQQQQQRIGSAKSKVNSLVWDEREEQDVDVS
ncbi:unnamed protein product [Notodromas monacha]|uniref:Cadherin domain-containing protein n=1 Tax=Notodromas monacha TaxID=399045 RepID=A0A7R9GCS5_9CRUS|nr:unnamed protein product [Notodromas monacha]CAG0916273.1 unnamed protein product [Notodromas monacha]